MIKKGFFLVALAAVMLVSCDDDNGNEPIEIDTEGQFVRILASDVEASNYYVINPSEGTLETVAGQYAAGRLYTSPSGRYVSVINTSENSAAFFDSGIEGHEDHAHIKGTPKWALTKSTGNRPVHFYGRGDNMLVFNDGDGTISHFKESTLHSEALVQPIMVHLHCSRTVPLPSPKKTVVLPGLYLKGLESLIWTATNFTLPLYKLEVFMEKQVMVKLCYSVVLRAFLE